MSTEIQSTIEVLAGKVKAKEEEANKLKLLINELCAEAGLPQRYDNVADISGGGSGSLRRDHFYGQTLTSAARSYLELRKSSGAASVDDIYRAIRDGGYKFETKIEENAKTALRNALRKTSSVFHRLPTGDYGLLAWYPGAKEKRSDESEVSAQKQKRGKKAKAAASKETATTAQPIGDFVTNDEIRGVIFKMEGNFTLSDVESKIKELYPAKTLRVGAASIALFKMKGVGFIRVISERKGNNGAQYAKA